jgi:NOL1/NOP2/fmu family ribosome biogenesis protein
MNFSILNSRETKKILQDIKEQWGAALEKEYAFIQNSEGKIFVVSRDIEQIDFDKININSFGLYLADYEKNNELRLSIEGSQMVGPKATKNIIELIAEESRGWLKGQDIPTNAEATGFVILKSGADYLGSGKIKDGRIMNFVPKTRRINASD